MATNSSPARMVRESIETPASRATGSRPTPRLPATASATCVTVHRIVASENLPVSGFGRGLHLVRSARLGAFSPVRGSSLIYESLLWAATCCWCHARERRRLACRTLLGPVAVKSYRRSPEPRSAMRSPARFATTFVHPRVRHRSRAPRAPSVLPHDRRNESCGPRKSGSPHGPCPPTARCPPLALLQLPHEWLSSDPVQSCTSHRTSACPPRCR